MLKSIFYAFFLLSLSVDTSAQNADTYKSATIPIKLSEAANAVVRYDNTLIEVNDYDDVIIKQKRIVTILNKLGQADMGSTVFYDENRKIKILEAKIYDEFGEEIKKFKKNDFEDVSAVDGGTLYSDNRVKYLRYIPIKYPYTLEFISELKLSSTAFLPRWFPLEGYHCSTEVSEYKIINNSDIEIKIKDYNLNDYNIEKKGLHHYTANNLNAIKWEAYSPDYHQFLPIVKIAMTDFNMEGVRGTNESWQDFGKWMYNELLVGTDRLPQSVIDEMQQLTSHLTDPIEKAKIVYNYVQDKTRYVSVQVGIGGWKPIDASDVDRVGYGDCKGLTNYTKALLESVGVNSNYAVIYGGHNIRNMDSDFSLTEGNHVILNIPNVPNDIWLECTSKTAPFGFVAGFTDDRDALIITPNGGEIVRTTAYNAEDNFQNTIAEIEINDNGDLHANLTVNSYGYQYAKKDYLTSLKESDQELKLKENWSHINNIKVEEFKFNANRKDVVFTQDIKLSAKNYADRAGTYTILQINPFNKLRNIPSRYPNRRLNLEIDRSQSEFDEYIISLPNEMAIDALPNNEEITTKFGSYSFKLEELQKNKLKYSRKFTVKKGRYSYEEYQDFREFLSTVYKYDNAKIALKAK